VKQVTLTARARDAALDRGVTTYPFEGCGLLIGYLGEDGVRVTRSLACPNVAEKSLQTHRFVIDPRAVLNVRRSLRGTAETIVGFYHSHPDSPAAPSSTDMEFIRLWPETVWLIVPVRGGEAGEPRAWWLDDVEAPSARELRVNVLAARAVAVTTCPD
jgi:proteasome lid subunit RPN8/RPN11